MKRKTKIIFSTLTVIITLLCVAVGCIAYAEGDSQSEVISDNNFVAEAPEEDVIITTPKTDQSENSDTDSEADKAGSGNIFNSAFEYVKGYASELFCALTLICSMVLTYACKTGIFPAIKSGVGIMSGAVKKIGEKMESAEKDGKEAGIEFGSKLKLVGEQLERLTDTVESLEKNLMPDELLLKREAEVKELLAAQVNLLSEIVFTVAMPQKTKERVGEKLSKLNEAVKSYGE